MSSVIESIKGILFSEERAKGTPVYLQENGDFLGKVLRREDDQYIVDCMGVEMGFSSEDLIKGDGGYIYKPPWYSDGAKVLASLTALRAKDPDLYVSSDISSNSEYATLVSQANATFSRLLKKKESLEKQATTLEDEMNALAGRSPGDIGRREYAKNIVNINRKLKIIEINLSKIEDLISKYERIPFIDVNAIEDMPNMTPDDNKETAVDRRISEGERIKKIRILKLEKNLAEKQIQVAEGYIKDRLRRINADIDDLTQMAKENRDNEKVLEFLKNRIADLRQEKEELQDKIKNIKHTDISEVQQDEEVSPIVETTTEVEPVVSGTDYSLITRVGSLVFIIGLIIVLLMSLFGIL